MLLATTLLWLAAGPENTEATALAREASLAIASVQSLHYRVDESFAPTQGTQLPPHIKFTENGRFISAQREIWWSASGTVRSNSAELNAWPPENSKEYSRFTTVWNGRDMHSVSEDGSLMKIEDGDLPFLNHCHCLTMLGHSVLSSRQSLIDMLLERGSIDQPVRNLDSGAIRITGTLPRSADCAGYRVQADLDPARGMLPIRYLVTYLRSGTRFVEISCDRTALKNGVFLPVSGSMEMFTYSFDEPRSVSKEEWDSLSSEERDSLRRLTTFNEISLGPRSFTVDPSAVDVNDLKDESFFMIRPGPNTKVLDFRGGGILRETGTKNGDQ